MISRRRFITTAALAGAGAAAAYVPYSFYAAKSQYERAARQTWRHFESVPAGDGAVCHAGAFESQHSVLEVPARGEVDRDPAGLRTVLSRRRSGRSSPLHQPGQRGRKPDPGGAGHGLSRNPTFNAGASESLEIMREPTPATRSPLFEAIPFRQSTRAEYDGRPLTNEELKLLEAAGTGNGVQVILLTEKQAMEKVLDYVIEGNTAQMRDAAFVRELKQWIRFNGAQAASTGDGLFSAASGNPTAPAWLGGLLFDAFFKEEAENDKYARHVRSSAGIAVFVSAVSDKTHWIEVGRAFERFALQARVLGVRSAHLNQPVEVAALRPQFAQSLGIAAGRPDLVIRFGRGHELPRSLRRPVEQVLI